MKLIIFSRRVGEEKLNCYQGKKETQLNDTRNMEHVYSGILTKHKSENIKKYICNFILDAILNAL